jgi:Glycosyl transferase family 90
LNVSLIALGSVLFGKLYLEATVWRLWLCVINITASALLFDDSLPSPVFFNTPKRRMRARQLIILVGGFSAVVLLVKLYQNQPAPYVAPVAVEDFTFPWEPPTEILGPVKVTDTSSHPISQLVDSAQTRFDQLLNRQSKTLDAAIKEYRRRYGIPPPPRFDVWFEFAKRRNVQLIDEFDNIHHSLLPFWGLEPSVIRKRVTEALGFDNNYLIGLCIRNGEVTYIKDGADWQQEATTGMMKSFIQYLPDMDLAFNIHDEPRVIVPHDLLSRLVHIAKGRNMPAASGHQQPVNSFSPRPADLNEGTHFAEVKVTRFNVFAHQPTWTHSRLSCPPDSPARAVDDSPRDNITSYAYSNLGFVYNHTAFSDICHSPSLRSTFGFFDRPNAFNIVQDLFPIFSQSKINSFQDILYPSPWYWAGKVEYLENRDMSWSSKESSLYWRGSTTGGFSRKGGWRRQHRQRVVRRLNAADGALIMHNNGTESSPDWRPQGVQRRDYAEIVDVKFSHVGQCDPDDCDAQKEFFQVTERVDQQDAWKYRYLLDMDGNAFSGRFYAFLRSNSLVFKMSLFAEWHAEWLKPWVHYIPVSLIGDEWLESVRYFAGEKLGKKQGPLMATAGQDWALKALRNEDIEVWFFRLLLE